MRRLQSVNMVEIELEAESNFHIKNQQDSHEISILAERHDQQLSGEFLKKIFTVLVRRLSCVNRDSTSQIWSFYACANDQTNQVSFLDCSNDQSLLDRVKSFDKTGQFDVEFFKYSEGGVDSGFTSIALITRPSESQTGNDNHSYMLVNSDKRLNLNDSNVIRIQGYFVNALSSLLH